MKQEAQAPQQAAITFAGEIEKAVLADGTEKEIGSADFNKNQLNVSIAPYSIQTFKVKPEEKSDLQSSGMRLSSFGL